MSRQRKEKMIPAIDWFIRAKKSAERPYEFYVYREDEMLRKVALYRSHGFTVTVKVYDHKRGYVPMEI